MRRTVAILLALCLWTDSVSAQRFIHFFSRPTDKVTLSSDVFETDALSPISVWVRKVIRLIPKLLKSRNELMLNPSPPPRFSWLIPIVGLVYWLKLASTSPGLLITCVAMIPGGFLFLVGFILWYRHSLPDRNDLPSSQEEVHIGRLFMFSGIAEMTLMFLMYLWLSSLSSNSSYSARFARAV